MVSPFLSPFLWRAFALLLPIILVASFGGGWPGAVSAAALCLLPLAAWQGVFDRRLDRMLRGPGAPGGGPPALAGGAPRGSSSDLVRDTGRWRTLPEEPAAVDPERLRG